MINTHKTKKVNFKARLFALISLIALMMVILAAERFIFNLSGKSILISLILEVISLVYFTWELTDGLD
jgi:hypothetical protein